MRVPFPPSIGRRPARWPCVTSTVQADVEKKSVRTVSEQCQNIPSCALAGTTAILAVAASKPTVVVDEKGHFFVAKQMRVNLTADHRLVYGVAAAEFMQTLKEVIENPDQLTF